MHNFLSNRQQCGAVNGTTSSEAYVRSGVPQWSVLGPLLFLINISDINYEIADSTVSCFADDTRILLGIIDEEDTQMLQNDLHKLYKCSDTNNIKFNANKFELLRYGKDKIIIYHDFLPTPRRGSHVKSGKTHTQSSRYTP